MGSGDDGAGGMSDDGDDGTAPMGEDASVGGDSAGGGDVSGADAPTGDDARGEASGDSAGGVSGEDASGVEEPPASVGEVPDAELGFGTDGSGEQGAGAEAGAGEARADLSEFGFPLDWEVLRRQRLAMDGISCSVCGSDDESGMLFVGFGEHPVRGGEYAVGNLSTRCGDHVSELPGPVATEPGCEVTNTDVVAAVELLDSDEFSGEAIVDGDGDGSGEREGEAVASGAGSVAGSTGEAGVDDGSGLFGGVVDALSIGSPSGEVEAESASASASTSSSSAAGSAPGEAASLSGSATGSDGHNSAGRVGGAGKPEPLALIHRQFIPRTILGLGEYRPFGRRFTNTGVALAMIGLSVMVWSVGAAFVTGGQAAALSMLDLRVGQAMAIGSWLATPVGVVTAVGTTYAGHLVYRDFAPGHGWPHVRESVPPKGGIHSLRVAGGLALGLSGTYVLGRVLEGVPVLAELAVGAIGTPVGGGLLAIQFAALVAGGVAVMRLSEYVIYDEELEAQTLGFLFEGGARVGLFVGLVFTIIPGASLAGLVGIVAPGLAVLAYAGYRSQF